MKRISKEEKIGFIATLLVHAVLCAVLYLLVLKSAESESDSTKEEFVEVLLDVEIPREEKTESSGVPERVEQKEPAEVSPVSQKQESALPDVGMPEPVEKTVSEEVKEIAPVVEQVSKDIPEPAVDPLELDKTIEDLVEKTTNLKEKVANKLDEIKKEEERRRIEKEKEEMERITNNRIMGAFQQGNEMRESASSVADNVSTGPSSTPENAGGPYLDLANRKVIGAIVKPECDFDEEGTIFVNITVTPKGEVSKAEVNTKTICANTELRAAALAAAYKTTFNEVDEEDNQEGTITYNFKMTTENQKRKRNKK